MCGIAGIFRTNSDQNPSSHDQTQIIELQKALSHRGPDSNGLFFSPSNNAAIAHTRLSIIDLSNGGQQPKSCPKQRYTISFNGEIYNYLELKKHLEQHGVTLSTNSDTEVLLQLYILEGESCVTMLRGMFAFIVWDELEQKVFAARDPFGIKPLYFWQTANQIAFASELKALTLSELEPLSLSKQGLFSYFRSGTVAEPNTLYEQIKLLGAGTHLTWQSGKTVTKKYWELGFNKKNINRQQAISQVRAALENSIQTHLTSDVSVGIFLSGGIDSCSLVALAQQQSSTPINTYSIAFSDPKWNEADIAKRVADHFGTNHTEFLVTPEIAKPLFHEFLKAVDQPTIDGFNTFCVSKLASQHGEKVVLSGLGGDEIFAGYKSFTVLPNYHKWSRRLRFFKPLAQLLSKHCYRWLNPKMLRTMDLLANPSSLFSSYQSLRAIFSEREATKLCQAYGIDYKTKSATANLATSCIDDLISKYELENYLRNQLLRDSDMASMACGLELRVPFIDKDFFEDISSIPSHYRLEAGKKLLIDAVPELPEWVVNRPKQGFLFPFDDWFKQEWSSMQNKKQLPKWLMLKPWYRHWSLLLLDHCIERDKS